MTPKERHEIVAEVKDCLCRSGPHGPNGVKKLCGDEGVNTFDARLVLTCGRPAGHDGDHLACAGREGPHAIASWGK